MKVSLMQRVATLFCIMLTLACAQPALATPAIPLYAHDNLSIATAKGNVALNVEVAKTAAQMENGLMYRTKLPEKTGMIFLFPAEQSINMWMKNTLLSLDMLFINKKGVIINIAANTKPESTDLIPSGGDVLAVIELAAGSAARLQIAKGDKVIYPYFHE